MNIKSATALVSALLILPMLTACTPNPTGAPDATDVPGTSVATISGDTALLNFVDMVSRSCEKARTEGVVETASGETQYITVMVPEAAAYESYSAVAIDPTKPLSATNPALIFEVDAFDTCSFDMMFTLASEGGASLTDLGVAVSITGDEWTVDQKIEGETYTSVYTVSDGVISKSLHGETTVTIEYGEGYKEYLDELQDAVLLLRASAGV